MFSAERYDRVSHALGKAYRDVVRGMRGEFEHPPDLVAYRSHPRTSTPCSTSAPTSAPQRSPTAAGPAWSAGSSRGSATTTGAWSRSTCGAWTGCSRSIRSSRAARIQAGALGPVSRTNSRARPHPAPLPPVVRVLDPGRLDRHPRRRPLRDPLHAHRRPGRVGPRRHPLGRVEAAGCRVGCRSQPRPRFDRVRGHPRRDHRRLGAGARAAAVEDFVRSRLR